MPVALEYEELNKDLAETGDRVKFEIDRIVERFKYRTMVNCSYNRIDATEKEEILYKKLMQCKEEIASLWNEIG